MMIRATTILVLALAAMPALAAPFRDGTTGLVVDPPSPYAVQAGAPDSRHAVLLALKRPDDGDTGCELGFAPSTANARLTQAEINALLSGDEGRDRASKALASTYDVLSVAATDLGPIRALVLQADFKARPELPPRTRQLRSYFALMETPRGRTTLVCVAERSGFTSRFAEFGAILRSITAP